jgi:phosphatidylserine decarboxylase
MMLSAIARLPERGLSRSFGVVADLPLPRPARRAVLGSFARAVGIDLSEVELPLQEYATLNAFFVRRLRTGVRSWPSGVQTLSSPVDGIVGRFGPIAATRAIQAKGREYSIAELLTDPGEAERFEGGEFLTIYLSPRHYHRIHTPAAGTIDRATYAPGALFPVNAAAVMHIPGLFTRNERVITYLQSARGTIGVVAVGAYNVGRISVAFDPDWGGGAAGWVTNRRPTAPLHRRYDPAREISIGEELMAFHLGSTVVLLFEPGVQLRPGLGEGGELRVGEPLTE